MRMGRVLAAATLLTIPVMAFAQPTTADELVIAAKRAAGRDYAGTFIRICVAPDNLGGGAPRAPNAAAGPRVVPDRATWYAQPYKVFDNLYFIGTRIHSAWALTTSEGIVVIDTLFDYAIEPQIVEGIRKLGLDPGDIEYVLISHAHGDHDQGAALLQERYGAKIVMGAPDWDSTLQRPATAAGGVPKRDVSVGPDGTKITLGDTTVEVVATPGHTPGHVVLSLSGARRRPHVARGLLRRHGVQLPASRRELRDLSRQRQEDGSCGRGGRRHRPDDEPYGVRRSLRPRAHRTAASHRGREASVRERRCNRATVFRDDGQLRRGAALVDE